jgi:DNA-binding response OmpR family regulator
MHEHHILIVSTDASVLTGRTSALTAAGYTISASAGFPDARQVLAAGTSPDVLITDVRLGPYNGLHLVAIARVEHPRTLGIVIGQADPVLEAEARGLAARYLIGPVSGSDLVAAVADALMAPRPRRRWPRKRPTSDIAVVVGGLRGRVLDVSYGGMALEVFGSEVPDEGLAVELPDHGLGLQGRRVWMHQLDPSLPFSCGISLPATDTTWRTFVDTLQAEAVLG